tara:strand:- start:4131 stop:5498 length:1368 start_codon:yes stop_codon:yes gene_type:complete
MAALPKEVQYNKPMASLPAETSSMNVNVRPSNGQVFSRTGGDIIQFDLPAHSFLAPSSLVLRGLIQLTPSATNVDACDIKMVGVPGASWIQRVETIVGGSLLESVNDYGRLYSMLSQTNIDYATKAGLAVELGLCSTTGATRAGLDALDPDFTNLNGRAGPNAGGGNDGVAGEFPFAIPLGCLLSSCSELIPLSHMGGVRIQLTTDQIANFIYNTGTGGNLPTIRYSQLELNFDLVDFGPAMDGVVRSMANADGDLVLKSQGWNVSNVNLPEQVAGSQSEFVYNVRLSSIKSLVVQGTGGAKTEAVNGLYDAVQVAGPTGSTQFFIANKAYPQTPLREDNTAAVMSALRQAFGQAHDIYHSNIAIPPKQWDDIASLATTTASTQFEPASHFVGMNTEKLSTNSVMMSGESSQLTPINVRLNPSVATDDAATLTLYACYDALIGINVASRQIQVRV